jgi:hypothetical protein
MAFVSTLRHFSPRHRPGKHAKRTKMPEGQAPHNRKAEHLIKCISFLSIVSALMHFSAWASKQTHKRQHSHYGLHE